MKKAMSAYWTQNQKLMAKVRIHIHPHSFISSTEISSAYTVALAASFRPHNNAVFDLTWSYDDRQIVRPTHFGLSDPDVIEDISG